MALSPASSRDASGGETQLAYAEIVDSVTVSAVTEAAPDNVLSAGAVTFDGATRVRIEFFTPRAACGAVAGSFLVINLWDDTTTDLGRIAVITRVGTSDPAFAVRYLTPSAAAHTYRIRAWRVNSNGTIFAGTGGGGAGEEEVPSFVRIVEAPA